MNTPLKIFFRSTTTILISLFVFLLFSGLGLLFLVLQLKTLTIFDPLFQSRFEQILFGCLFLSFFINGLFSSYRLKKLAVFEIFLFTLFAAIFGYYILDIYQALLFARSGFEAGIQTLFQLPSGQFYLLFGLCFFPGAFGVAVMGSAIGFIFFHGGIDPHFGFESMLAGRYLMSKRKSSFISVITIISIAGVAVGVMALIVVLSVMSGFEYDLKEKIIGTSTHITIRKYGHDFYEYRDILEKASHVQGVSALSPFIRTEVMISSSNNLSGILLKGVDPYSISKVEDLKKNLIEGDIFDLLPSTATIAEKSQIDSENNDTPVDIASIPPKPIDNIIIGKELAKILSVFVGDQINVISPLSSDLSPLGFNIRHKVFRVSGLFYSGMYEFDSKFAYVGMHAAQNLLNIQDRIHGIEVKTVDMNMTDNISQLLKIKVGGYPYRIEDWKEMNRNLFSALKLEKITMFIVIAITVLVASFNIVSTLIMVVLEKGKEIAILKSMGAKENSVMKIFVIQGLTIGLVGTILGVLLGIAICLFVKHFGIGLDQEIYYIEKLPVKMEAVEIMLVAVSAVGISFLATVYPAIQAARLNPVEGLRYE